MPRIMSCAESVPAVLVETKTLTRSQIDELIRDRYPQPLRYLIHPKYRDTIEDRIVETRDAVDQACESVARLGDLCVRITVRP